MHTTLGRGSSLVYEIKNILQVLTMHRPDRVYKMEIFIEIRLNEL